MRQVNINVATVDTPLAPGQTPGNWIVDVLEAASGAVVQSHPDLPNPSIPVMLEDGTYIFNAKRLDSTGALFGSISTSDPVVVTTPTGQSAGAITVTLS